MSSLNSFSLFPLIPDLSNLEFAWGIPATTPGVCPHYPDRYKNFMSKTPGRQKTPGGQQDEKKIREVVQF